MGGKPHDITNNRYGKLVVMSHARKNNVKWATCKCDCGNIITVRAADLQKGTTLSCGCYRKECQAARTKDLTNQVFGRLTAKEHFVHKEKSWWVCTCQCGKAVSVLANSLLNGHTRSCGCYRRDILTTHGLTGTRLLCSSYDKIRRERELEMDSKWKPEMEIALRTFRCSCALCGMSEEEHIEKYGTSLHVDHIRPLSKGFGLYPGNVALLCASCNRKKWNKDINDLPLETQANLIWAAIEFKNHWEHINRGN